MRVFAASLVAGLLLLGTSAARAQTGSGAIVLDWGNQFALQNLFGQARGNFGMWSKLDSATGRILRCTTMSGCYMYRQRIGTSTYYINAEPYGNPNWDHLHLPFTDPTLSPGCTCRPDGDTWMDEPGQSYSVGYGRCAPSPACPSPSWGSLDRSHAYPHTERDGIYLHLDTNKPFDVWDITVGPGKRVVALWNDGVNTYTIGPINPGYSALDISNAYWVRLQDYDFYMNGSAGSTPGPIAINDMYIVAPGGQLNIGYMKPATQSSIALGGVPSRAVDWNENGNWSGNSVTHTNFEAASWMMDLKIIRRVGRVKIFNRTDCCGERLANFDVQLMKPDNSGWESIYVPSVAASTTVDFAGKAGRWLRIKLRSSNYLSLAEVEVFAPPGPF